jgi:hypothetical protein
MDYGKILDILGKGLKLIPTLIEVGGDVLGTTQKMLKVAEDAKAGKVVPESELAALEAELDAMLDEFNSPMPPKA